MSEVGTFPERGKLSDLTKRELIDIIKEKSIKNRQLIETIKKKDERIRELQSSNEDIAKKYSEVTRLIVRR